MEAREAVEKNWENADKMEAREAVEKNGKKRFLELPRITSGS